MSKGKLEAADVQQQVKNLTDKWRKEPGQHFINGQWLKSRSGKTFTSINPANQEVLREVARGDKDDINDAVSAARKALHAKEWKLLSPTKRAEIIHKIGDLIRDNALELAVTESLDNGKTVHDALRGDVPPAWDIFHYYAGWTTKMQGQTIPVSGPFLNYTLREPMGVCGQIIPWNYPLLMAAWKIAPALACGNTVVLKPAEQTPLSALRLAELCKEAGLPDGVLNVVSGFGEDAGAALTSHMDVDKVAFTGSTEVGKKIMEAAARSNLKRVSLELGGKSPQIIFSDADMKKALSAVFYGIFSNKGEICSAGSRIYVEKDIYGKFQEELVTMAKGLKMGSPQALDTGIGALVTREQAERVMGYIEKGKTSGAKLLTGGKRGEGDLSKGNFVEPTIFGDVPDEAVIAKEEIFGPVLTVMPLESEEEAIAKANASPYGLVASVWTNDIKRALRVAHALQAGVVSVNSFNNFDSASPFGGYKQSGFGREMGEHALELYTQVKSVWVSLR